MFANFFLIFAICIYKINCEPVSFTEAVKQCSSKFNMTEIDPDLDDFVKYGKFPPGHENKKCIFECVFKTADLVDSNFVPSRKKIFDAFVRETGTGNANSARGGELLDLIEKCLPAPQDLPSPCNIISNFVLCFFDIMRVIDVKSIPPGIDTDSVSIKDLYSKNIASAVNSCKRMKKFGY